MFLKVPARLETERLIIRPFNSNDLDAFYSFMSDEKATKYLSLSDEQKTFEGTKELLSLMIGSYDQNEQIYALAIERKTDGQFIGSVGLGPDFEGTDFQIFWFIVHAHLGKRYGYEATRELLRFAFYELGLKRITAYSHPGNIASERLALKVGMAFEGTSFIGSINETMLKFIICADP